LWSRDTVVQAGGWDEQLHAGQDKDILLSAGLAGGHIVYQSGCHAIYRRYGHVTVSTGNKLRWLENHARIFQKAEQALCRNNRLTPIYCQALAHSYYAIGANYCTINNDLYIYFISKTLELCPGFSSSTSGLFRLAQSMIGFTWTEHLACFKRRLWQSINNLAKKPARIRGYSSYKGSV
jgi:hypothetical protein